MFVLLICLGCLSCGADLPEVGQQVVVTAEESKLYSGVEVVGKAEMGDVLTVLEVNGGWLRVETDVSGWIDDADVATAKQLRKKVKREMDAEQFIDALDTVSQLLKMDKERTWQDCRTRADLIPLIVLRKEHLTKDKFPIAIDGMTLVLSDWQDAQQLGADESMVRVQLIKAHLSRADLSARLASANGGEFTPPILCQVIRGAAKEEDRDLAAASEQLQKAVQDHVEVDRLVKAHDGILTSKEIRERGQRLAKLYRQLGDCLLANKELDEADQAYAKAVETAESGKDVVKYADVYGLSLWGRGLVRQQRGEGSEAEKYFAQGIEIAEFGTPGLDKELKHWTDPDAKPLPSNVAIRPDGKKMTMVEEVIDLIAKTKGLKPDKVKATTKLTDLQIDEFDLLDIVEQLEERHRAAISLVDIERATGTKTLEHGPTRGTVSTLAELMERAKEAAKDD